MIGLFDRDVFLKLSCCDLWDLAIEAIGITEPYRLASTNSISSNRKALARKFLSNDVLALALGRVAELTLRVPIVASDLLEGIEASLEYQSLANVEDIDGGEQVLVAIVLQHPTERLFVSGDKRFFNAFRASLPDDWLRVQDSLISFESCLLAIEQRCGFDEIHMRAYLTRHCDDTLKLAFGETANSDSFCAALRSYDPCKENSGYKF